MARPAHSMMLSARLNPETGEKILLTIWIGALWSIGYLAVPTLFATLSDRHLAGLLAGKMFTAVSYVGLVCGILLLFSAFRKSVRIRADIRIWLLVLMLCLVIVGEFVLQPMMSELKLSGIIEGSAAAVRFDNIHHWASTLYMINSLLGLGLVIFSGQEDDQVATDDTE